MGTEADIAYLVPLLQISKLSLDRADLAKFIKIGTIFLYLGTIHRQMFHSAKGSLFTVCQQQRHTSSWVFCLYRCSFSKILRICKFCRYKAINLNFRNIFQNRKKIYFLCQLIPDKLTTWQSVWPLSRVW